MIYKFTLLYTNFLTHLLTYYTSSVINFLLVNWLNASLLKVYLYLGTYMSLLCSYSHFQFCQSCLVWVYLHLLGLTRPSQGKPS